jgi:1-deoxy-D-xylulose-5-phosphate reductoisomerase
MRRIALLGSTGSIGRYTIEIAQHLGPEKVQIVGLAARSNGELLESQAKALGVRNVALESRDGMEKVIEVATASDVDWVVMAMSGTASILPTWAAIQAGKHLALANKEVIVSAGETVMEAIRRKAIQVIPIDSEHSGLFQCLQGRRPDEIARVMITASGGPFRLYTDEQLEQITPQQALRHPVWPMGAKITVDSSTLMNKGLEVIEASWLFNIPPERIGVLIHPQSYVHALVELTDGTFITQVGRPDMRLPIQFALTYPDRAPSAVAPFDWTTMNKWEFSLPDTNKFICLRLAMEALQAGGTMTAWLNGANQIFVERFLRGELSWKQIGQNLERIMQRHQPVKRPTIDDVLAVDQQARQEALA